MFAAEVDAVAVVVEGDVEESAVAPVPFQGLGRDRHRSPLDDAGLERGCRGFGVRRSVGCG
ncbi:hypothetical protein [Cryobacterium sp. MDB1-18-2]|uniref:hypothetical protein n=1 Tax=Cryobacterium sp. MDB1-18-2 TaxID=1259169 RepID=UPI00141B119F|nr:hypothetical protein [Cryobacterium sp. MDB1-18-2]